MAPSNRLPACKVAIWMVPVMSCLEFHRARNKAGKLSFRVRRRDEIPCSLKALAVSDDALCLDLRARPTRQDIQKVTTLAEMQDTLMRLELPSVAPLTSGA